MNTHKVVRRLSNLARYGIGSRGKERKQADQAKRRAERFQDGDLWAEGADGEIRRRYESYADYVDHQAAKLGKITDRLRETEDEDLAEFRRRFEGCAPLGEARTVLCLGARLGIEVRAFLGLGHFAVGIDLQPGPDNPYVLVGDFHHVVFPDGAVDAVYTNALDHVFALDKVVAEVRRLLRPGGVFIADLVHGYDEGYVPGEFEARHWRDRASIVAQIAELGQLTVESTRDLGYTRRDQWTQVVFRKPV